MPMPGNAIWITVCAAGCAEMAGAAVGIIGLEFAIVMLASSASVGELLTVAAIPIVLGALFAIPLFAGPWRLSVASRPKRNVVTATALWCGANLIALTVAVALLAELKR